MHKFFLVLWETVVKNVLTIGGTLYIIKNYAKKGIVYANIQTY